MTRDKNHPTVSVVVVTYDMARELPRTLQSLAVPYQRDIGADDYEVIVVDNGSPEPVDQSLCDRFPGHLRHARIDVPGRRNGPRIGQRRLSVVRLEDLSDRGFHGPSRASRR